MKYVCKCCGCAALDSADEYDICPVCFWEKDKSQERDPEYKGGANSVSLNEARKNYAEFGACEKRFIEKVRKPEIIEKAAAMRRKERREDEDFAFDDRRRRSAVLPADIRRKDRQETLFPFRGKRQKIRSYDERSECLHNCRS